MFELAILYTLLNMATSNKTKWANTTKKDRTTEEHFAWKPGQN